MPSSVEDEASIHRVDAVANIHASAGLFVRSDWPELTCTPPLSRMIQRVIDIFGELASLQVNAHIIERSPEPGPLIELKEGRTVR